MALSLSAANNHDLINIKKFSKEEAAHLLRIASFENDFSMVKQLTKEHKEAVHIPGPESLRTPLHRACEKGHDHVVAYLLKSAGANPNVKDYQGNTPLHLVIQADLPLTKKIAIIDVLLSHKADATLANNEGQAAKNSLKSIRDARPIGSHLRAGLDNIVRKMNKLICEEIRASNAVERHEEMRRFGMAAAGA